VPVQIPVPQPPPHPHIPPPLPRRQPLNGRHPSISRPADKSPPQPPRRKPNTPPSHQGGPKALGTPPGTHITGRTGTTDPRAPDYLPFKSPTPPPPQLTLSLSSTLRMPTLPLCPLFSSFFFVFLPLFVSTPFNQRRLLRRGHLFFSRFFVVFFVFFLFVFFRPFLRSFFVIVPPVRFSPHGNNNKQEQSNQHPSNRRYPTWQQQ
jgi:hypothetical protein